MAKNVSFINWIHQWSAEDIARMLRVTRDNVYHWRNGRTLPSDEMKLRIIKMSRGTITFEEMISSHYSKKNEKNRLSRKKRGDDSSHALSRPALDSKRGAM